MSILATTLAVLTLALQDPAMPGVAMADRVGAQSQNATAEGCDLSVSESDVRNAEGLFVGAAVCFGVDREDDAIFLLLAAQSRAMADMELAMPANLPEADEYGVIDLSNVPQPPFGVIDLYGFIYGYGGGPGPTVFYRDVARTDHLFARLRGWSPVRPEGYNPGWGGSREASDETYAASIQANVEHRIGQLTPLAILLRDDAYYALNQEAEALREANNSTFTEGTPEFERHRELDTAMDRRRRELGVEF
ncbi:MAG: hypothetical protein ACK4FG_06405 [Brevundimonas sp.]